MGPPGVGKTSLAWLVAAALGRVHAWVAYGELSRAADVHGARSGPPGRIVGELRRVGVRNPVFILDGIDRLDDGGGVAAALHEALAPMPGAAFRDRYVDLPFDLSDALFVATANRLTPVPAGLREAMTVVEVPGYTEDEKRAIVAGHLLPLQLARHGLTAEQVRVTEPGMRLASTTSTSPPAAVQHAVTSRTGSRNCSTGCRSTAPAAAGSPRTSCGSC